MSLRPNPSNQQQPEGFLIKVYSKAQLAALYFPELTPQASRNAFLRFLKNDDKLYTSLIEMGYGGVRLLPPKIVKAIVEGLGEP